MPDEASVPVGGRLNVIDCDLRHTTVARSAASASASAPLVISTPIFRLAKLPGPRSANA
jgi:hypothetical protein